MELADRDFTVQNEINGWNYPLIFHEDRDKKGNPKVIYVNRHALAATSRVFEKIFYDTNFADASKSHVPISGQTFTEFYEFIDFVAITDTSNGPKELTMDNIEVLYHYADQYDVRNILYRCKLFIGDYLSSTSYHKLSVERKADRETIIQLYLLSQKLHLSEFPDVLSRIARFPLPEIRKFGQEVDKETLMKIMDIKLDAYTQLRYKKSDVVYATCKNRWCCVCNAYTSDRSPLVFCVGDCCGPRESFYCLGCYAASEEHAAQKRDWCPNCESLFQASTEVTADRCNCDF